MSESAKKTLPVIVVVITWVYILAWASVSLGWVDPAANIVIYTIPVLVVLIGGLVASRRHPALMTYMMTVVAHFLYFY